MTDTRKAIVRRSIHEHSRYGRRIVITIGAGDVIGFRLERAKESETAYLPLEQLFNQAELARAKAQCGESLAPCSNPKKIRNV